MAKSPVKIDRTKEDFSATEKANGFLHSLRQSLCGSDRQFTIEQTFENGGTVTTITTNGLLIGEDAVTSESKPVKTAK
jgi:hypothetical protein